MILKVFSNPQNMSYAGPHERSDVQWLVSDRLERERITEQAKINRKNQTTLKGFACTVRTQFLALQQNSSIPNCLISIQMHWLLIKAMLCSSSLLLWKNEFTRLHTGRVPTNVKAKSCWRMDWCQQLGKNRNQLGFYLKPVCFVWLSANKNSNCKQRRQRQRRWIREVVLCTQSLWEAVSS